MYCVPSQKKTGRAVTTVTTKVAVPETVTAVVLTTHPSAVLPR